MQDLLQALGWVALVALVAVGVLAGWIASRISGGHTGRYVATGVVAAVATPFVLAAVGLAALAAYGIAAVLVVALIGAAVVLLIARLVFD